MSYQKKKNVNFLNMIISTRKTENRELAKKLYFRADKNLEIRACL
jgi:hypothetical protein